MEIRNVLSLEELKKYSSTDLVVSHNMEQEKDSNFRWMQYLLEHLKGEF